MSKKEKAIYSSSFNGIIFILVLFASIMSMGGFWTQESQLESSGIENLKYYTWQSNLLSGLMSLIYVVYNILILNKKVDKIPSIITFFKFFGLVALGVTFISILFLFVPILLIQNNYYNLYANSNLFFHLIVPLLATISYVLFDYQKKYNIKFILLSCLSTVLYGTYYLINVIIHMNPDLSVDSEYDWYGYASNGVAFYPVSFIVTFLIAFGFAYLVNFVSYKVQNKLYENH